MTAPANVDADQADGQKPTATNTLGTRNSLEYHAEGSDSCDGSLQTGKENFSQTLRCYKHHIFMVNLQDSGGKVHGVRGHNCEDSCGSCRKQTGSYITNDTECFQQTPKRNIQKSHSGNNNLGIYILPVQAVHG